jgi:hypothetical protein
LIETNYSNTEEGIEKLRRDEEELRKKGLRLEKIFILRDEIKNRTFIKALWQPSKNSSLK